MLHPILCGLMLALLFASNSIMDAIKFTRMQSSKFADFWWHALKWFFFVPGLVFYGAAISKHLFVWLRDVWHPDAFMLIQGTAFVLSVVVWQAVYNLLKKQWSKS